MQVFEKVVKHRVHRVYLVEEGRPLGVITLTDLLRLLFPNQQSVPLHKDSAPKKNNGPVTEPNRKRVKVTKKSC